MTSLIKLSRDSLAMSVLGLQMGQQSTEYMTEVVGGSGFGTCLMSVATNQ